MQNRHFLPLVGLMAGVCWLGSVLPCHAQMSFRIAVNTAPLVGHPAGPFFVDFDLTDGSGTNDANNTALISNFAFGGGGPVGAPTLSGEASGNLSTAVRLNDSHFLNEFIQEFTPGDTLTFDVGLTTNVDAGPTPDEFSFKILDCTQVEIPTTGLGDKLLLVDINSSPIIETFASDPSRAPACGGGPFTPQVVPSVTPEPGTLAFLLSAVGGLVVLRRRKRKYESFATPTDAVFRDEETLEAK
jgi:hypothetical protein